MEISPAKSVFQFTNYRSYLSAKLGEVGHRTGERLKASKSIGCHSTYISQVLNEKIHLSLEYAEGLNKFLQHSADESDFFLLLLQRDRAGTTALKDRLSKMIHGYLEKRKIISSRLDSLTNISVDEQSRFYSDWIYTAIHVLVSIPKFQNVDEVAQTLGLSRQMVVVAVEFLKSIGVVTTVGNRIKPGPQHIHVGTNSLHLANHHANWRFHSVRSVNNPQLDDVHFSSVLSLSEFDADYLREKLLKELEGDIKYVKASKEEVAYVYNFDFYKLNK